MASAAVNLVAKKVLREEAQKRLASKQDPYFITVKNKKGKPVQVKRSDNDIPPGISASDAKILLKVRRRAYRLDNSMTVPILHVRYGVSALIGLLPVVGDFADVLLGLTVYNTCRKAGLDKETTAKMLFNIGLDGVLGLIPLLGDVADTFFRCNTRNLIELEKFLTKKGLANLEKMRAVENGGAGVVEMDELRGSPPPRYESRDGRGNGRRTESPAPQERVRIGTSGRADTGRSGRHGEREGRGTRREERALPVMPPRRDRPMF
ncbi:MAG: hypothetical protein LQ343_006424 [Gyalolechia ehrenbergii]|nr:MAG: hypothetical protein LQ343_006424 [Gyalolechia ehrenbergii]